MQANLQDPYTIAPFLYICSQFGDHDQCLRVAMYMYIHSTCLFFTCYVYKCISIIAGATSTPSPTGTACIQCMGQIVSSRVYSFCLNEKALKCKSSALIFGHGRAKELLHVRDDLRSEHVTESIRKSTKAAKALYG